MNLATIIVLALVAIIVVIDIIALSRGKGRCSCGDKKKSGCSDCSLDCPFRR